MSGRSIILVTYSFFLANHQSRNDNRRPDVDQAFFSYRSWMAEIYAAKVGLWYPIDIKYLSLLRNGMVENLDSNGSVQLETMNALQVKRTIDSDTVAIFVVGACENHGDHMPFGSDFIFPNELLKKVAANSKNVIVLPHVPYGMSSHHDQFQMTISLRASTLIKMIQDICYSLIRNGIRRILIINGHDGNVAPIENASRIVKNKYPEVVIACLETWWTLVGKSRQNLFDVWDGLGHGGEAETSAMLAVRPELVQMINAPKEIIPVLPANIRIYWKFNELSDTGATGAPRKATVEKGYEVLRVLESILSTFLENMETNDWKYGISRK
jgi:creatinine amidohydrolase